ncbi:MaoC family dehydratase [Flammeovirga sp. MY04]|uniref:MaoC family dehydratase n=1 Tax=Flammeovirga sp. MY04 TaxID=1191459 RepID=UPI0008062BFD|nr:MaoC family dehydratase [Flammeovirga sp. MY04]ANQ50238.1 MaoC family dehydratase [Flammeovirga sp. MY04]
MENKIIDCSDKFGHYYEEFEIGSIFKHWPGKTITESDNNMFSLLTMNHHPVHLDTKYCESHQHGKILVVGTLVFSVVVGMTVSEISGKAIANLQYESVNHVAPVFIGDTIYAETEVLDKRPSKSKSDRGIVYVETKAYNQDNIHILTFRRKVLIPKK